MLMLRAATFGLAGLVLVHAHPLTAQMAEAPSTSTQTRLVLLGTGTPNADPERSGPAVAVVVGERAYLVDAGPGVVRRAASAAARHGLSALAAENLDVVFLTHLHSDHTVGLPDLLLSPWVLERPVPLRVIGPRGTRAMVDAVRMAWEQDIAIRLNGLEGANDSAHHAMVTEIDSAVIRTTHTATPGTSVQRAVSERVVYQDSLVTVRAFQIRHGNWPQSFAYRFDTADRSILISGDAAPDDVIIEACQGCDILVHEVFSADRLPGRPAKWQRYHPQFHTSTTDLARIATAARPGLLVLYHQLMWGATDEELEAEIRRGWNGRVRSGRDLDVF